MDSKQEVLTVLREIDSLLEERLRILRDTVKRAQQFGDENCDFTMQQINDLKLCRLRLEQHLDKAEVEVATFEKKFITSENELSNSGSSLVPIPSMDSLTFSNSPGDIPPEFLNALNDNFGGIVNLKRAFFHRVVRSCLRGEAKDWWYAVERFCNNYEDFRRLFLQKFWCEKVQRRLRTGLMTGYYRPNCGNVKRYCMYWYRVAKALGDIKNDHDLLLTLSKHFRLMDLVMGGHIKTIDQLSEFLEHSPYY